MAPSTTRMLSIALLLLSCAPLTSLYALMVSSNWIPDTLVYVSRTVAASPTTTATTTNDTPSNTDDPNNKPAPTSLEGVLQDPNSTLEELWAVLFRERGGSVMMAATLPTMQVHHWTIVLPWGISLILGVVIPCLLSLVDHLRPEDDDEDGDDPWISRFRTNEKRLNRLMFAIKDHSKVLEEADLDPSGELDNEGVPSWCLPLPGEPTYPGTTRKVAGLCAVCLGCYACGDQVVWSSNPKCPHVYHEDCLLSWLVRRRKQCPCCRRAFLMAEEES